jgi:hypothetical protein
LERSGVALGGFLSNYFESVPLIVGRWVLSTGLGLLALGVLLYAWPMFLGFFAQPA